MESDRMSAKQARELGAESGRQDARTVADEQGLDALRGTLKPGELDWDEGAREEAERIVAEADALEEP